MSVLTSLRRLFAGAGVVAGGSAYPLRQHVNIRIQPAELPPAAMYAVLKVLYETNGAYDELARSGVTIGRATPQIKAIRSPIVPVVRFWGSKLYPRPLAIETKKPAIVAPIEQVWRWSNWRAKLPMFARWVALYGEAFIKVVADQAKGRVWFEYLEPAYVTDFEEDSRGYLIWVRVDVPKVDETKSGRRIWTHTEVWSTAEQRYRRWETDGDAAQRSLDDLGTPSEETPYSELAIDFTPFVRTVFADEGGKRGVGAVGLHLEPIMEADLSATNLHSMLYVDADGQWVATAAATDAGGRPLPPLTVGAAQPAYDSLGRQTSNGTGARTDGSIAVGKRSFWRLPPGYDLKSVVANINYEAALAVLQDQDQVLERLMPALAYARIVELSGGDLSGRAIRFKLTPAVDQVLDVRSTALEKLAQADAMALTLGGVNGIPGFQNLGTFEAGDFEHTFEDVDPLPIGDYEAAQTEQLEAQAYAAWIASGLPMGEALQRVGYTRTDAARVVRLAAAEAEAAMERQQAAFSDQPPADGSGDSNAA